MSTVVVTGAASGIGFALAKAFGARGARVLLADIRAERLDQAVAELAAAGVTAAGRVCDVRRPEDFAALAEAAFAEGPVSHVFLNAGVALRAKRLVDVPLDDFQTAFDVNIMGVVHGARAFLPRLIAQGTPSSLIATGSENSLASFVPHAAAYVMS